MSIKNPCHGCEERTATCHAGCGKYKVYREQMDERSRTIYKSSVPDKMMYIYNTQEKSKKLKKWRHENEM